MELALQSNSVPYLKRIVSEVLRQEETGETIVPDSEPDIGTILSVEAVPILRGKDCRSGSVILSGGVKGSILYLPEGENQPRCLELYLPFSMKAIDPALTEQSQVIASIQVISAEGRAINSRKAMLRVELGCQMQAFLPVEDTFCQITQPPKCLQLKQTEYKLMLPLETTEKSFQISETMVLPVPCIRLCDCAISLELGDTRLMGNKGLFKGNAQCKILYTGEDQLLHVHRQSLPFSQFCEFLSDLDGEVVDYVPCITGYDLDWDRSGAADEISVLVHVLMQAVVSGRKTIHLIEDAYVTCGQLNALWQDTVMEVELDRQRFTKTVQKELEGPVVDVIDCQARTDWPQWILQGGQQTMETRISVSVIGYDRQGILCSMSGSVTQAQNTEAAETEQCVCQSIISGPLSLLPVPNGLEAKAELITQAQWFAKQTLRSICGASTEEQAQHSRRPAIVLKRVAGDTTIWEIAKASCAQPEAICQANDWSSDQVPAGEILLIPIG